MAGGAQRVSGTRFPERLGANPSSALEKLHRAAIQTTVITTVNASNIDDIRPMRRMLTELGVSAWQVQPLFQAGRCKDSPELHLSPGQFVALEPLLAELVAEPNDRPEVRVADGFGYFCGNRSLDGGWRGCPAGIAACGIMSDGRVKGCLSLPDDLSEGSVAETSLWSIWFREGAFSYTRGFRLAELGPNCSGCPQGVVCKGGCSVMSLAGSGRLHNDPYCFRTLASKAGNGVLNS